MSVFARESATLPARDVSEKYVCTADSSDSAAKKRKKKKRRRKKTKLARKRRGRRRKKKEKESRRKMAGEKRRRRKVEKGKKERTRGAFRSRMYIPAARVYVTTLHQRRHSPDPYE